MKTVKEIKIPIYFGHLRVIITDDLNEVIKKYNLEHDGASEAFVFTETESNGYVTYCIALTKNKIDNSLIVHEVIHLVNLIFIDKGIKLDFNNDEPQAYLAGWIFKQIEKVISSKNIITF